MQERFQYGNWDPAVIFIFQSEKSFYFLWHFIKRRKCRQKLYSDRKCLNVDLKYTYKYLRWCAWENRIKMDISNSVYYISRNSYILFRCMCMMYKYYNCYSHLFLGSMNFFFFFLIFCSKFVNNRGFGIAIYYQKNIDFSYLFIYLRFSNFFLHSHRQWVFFGFLFGRLCYFALILKGQGCLMWKIYLCLSVVHFMVLQISPKGIWDKT